MFQGVFAFKHLMKIKEQTRNLGADCSKYSLEVINRTDEVSSKHSLEVVYKVNLTWFEAIFEEYKKYWSIKVKSLDLF